MKIRLVLETTTLRLITFSHLKLLLIFISVKIWNFTVLLLITLKLLTGLTETNFGLNCLETKSMVKSLRLFKTSILLLNRASSTPPAIYLICFLVWMVSVKVIICHHCFLRFISTTLNYIWAKNLMDWISCQFSWKHWIWWYCDLCKNFLFTLRRWYYSTRRKCQRPSIGT